MKKKVLFDHKKIINSVLKERDIKITQLTPIERVENGLSTGSFALDLIIGGKLAGGFRTNVFGKEAAGKSTIIFNMIRDAISKKVHVILFDAENAMQGNRLMNAGVDVNSEYLTYIDDIKDGDYVYETIYKILIELPDDTTQKQPQVAIIVDSIAALVPKAKLEGSKQLALEAKMHKGISLYKGLLKQKNVMVLDTNHLKQSPGFSYGNPEYEPGGETPKHLSEVRIRMAKISNATVVGTWKKEEPCWDEKGIDKYTYSKLKTVKNKLFSPFRECYVRFCYETAGSPGYGFDPSFDAFEYLRLTGQSNYKKGWVTFNTGIFEKLPKMRWKEFKKCIFSDTSVKVVKTKSKKNMYDYFKKLSLLEEDNDIEKLNKEYESYLARLEEAITQKDIRQLIVQQLEDGSAFKYLFDVSGEVKKPAIDDSITEEPVTKDNGSFNPLENS